MQREKILIVDDSEMNRSILADMLGEEYEILEAEDGVQALSTLREESGISLMLLDIVMPRLDGFEVLEALNRSGQIVNVPVIMISAESGSRQMARAYDLGVSDFISRPFDALIVRKRVVNTLLLYAKQKRLTDMVEEQIFETERRSSMMIEILSQVVEFRNGECGMHVLNVRLITELLLQALIQKTDHYDLSDADIARISVGSALHDIGKICIDEKILNKPGKLTQEEFEIMKTHTVQGAEMLDSLPEYRNDPLVSTARDICRWHHERYDGRGYPDGLKGDEIPIAAQVVALADVYDALVSERAYKKPFPHETAVEMIVKGQCGVFNPLLLTCLTENAERIRQNPRRDDHSTVYREMAPSMANAGSRALNRSASDRTLRLLDYERMKYGFFSAMTREIQFEYTPDPPTLNMATWGAALLGVDEIIMDPANDQKLQAVLGADGWDQLMEQLRQTTPDSPEASYDCLLTYHGKTRWHRIYLRTIWSEDVPPKLKNALAKVVDIHDTREKLEELETRASHDSMTDLLNRRAAMEKIRTRMESHPDGHFALAIIDLDHFKSANDNFGHQFGDEILKEVARRMQHSVRGSDIACRAGGDEFMLFLEYPAGNIDGIAGRIFHSLCGSYGNYNISVSMGLATADAVGKSYDSLFHAADAALYAVKRSGRAIIASMTQPSENHFSTNLNRTIDLGGMDLKLQECYEHMDADWNGVLERLYSERLVQKFVLKFLDDQSFNLLCRSMADADWDQAFRASHTLKGVCLNLGFTHLGHSSNELTEALRSHQVDEAASLLEEVKADYARTISAIRAFQSELGTP